jgi:glucosyl-dolichyl phosphate glucuronosyltransferase
MTTHQDVSVIICAYTMKRWSDICEAVESLRNGTVRPREIILVSDNNEELLIAMKAQFPDDIVIPNTLKRGLSGARNSGINIAQSPYVAFLDDDATVAPGWLATLAPYCGNTDVYGIASMVSPMWIGTRPRWFPDEFLWVVGCSFKGLPETYSEVRNVLGGSMCVRREAFERVGGFNPALGRANSFLPISCEETEWCLRARRDIPGLKFMMEPNAVSYHKVPADRLTWKYLAIRCLAEGISKARLTKMHGSTSVLHTEKSYVARTLTASVLRYAGETLRGDLSGLGRIAAVVVGLGSAVLGYAGGILRALPAEATGHADSMKIRARPQHQRRQAGQQGT